MKIRVLQIIDLLGPGGAEMLILTLARGINRSRFDLHVCSLRAAPQYDHAARLREMGIPVTELHQRNAYDLPALLAIVRYVLKHKIDVIHTHLLASDVMGRAAGALTRTPVLSTIHNSRADLDEEPPRRQWLERWTARFMCRRLIAVSPLLRDEIADWFGVSRSKVISIPNGVDTQNFHRDADFDKEGVREALVGGNYPMVVNVGRMVPQKAQTHLLEAARIVIQTRPDVRFVLLGDGVEREKLEALSKKLHLENNVIFTGFRNDIPDILAASDVFALSSLWEGLPIALLEAMSAGCASVCTDVGGVSEVLRHGETGLLVPPSNPEALASALLCLLNNPARAREMGEAAKRWAVRRYSMEAWVKSLEKLYTRYA